MCLLCKELWAEWLRIRIDQQDSHLLGLCRAWGVGFYSEYNRMSLLMPLTILWHG